MVLSADIIKKNYKKKSALSNFSVQFTPGIWGLLGPNGAGKTTLMKILVGIIRDFQGDVLFEEKNISELGMMYRQQIGYLPQKFGCYESLTVREYLKYMAALKDVPSDKVNKCIDNIVQELTLKDKMDLKINTLSGGTRQRVGIAQAMLNDPKILILDEPTSGLDIEERRKFREYIVKAGRERIVIISTHIVSDIEFISDKIVIMKNGSLLSNGNTDKLIQTLDGKVWTVILENNTLENWKDKLILVNYHNVDTINTEIRYVSDKQVFDNAVPAKPELNDYYLYVNKRG